jgi:hypothetical protein
VTSILAGQVEKAKRGEPEPSPEGAPHQEPLCPRCRARLGETAASRVLKIVPEGEGEARSVTVVFCRSCGTSLGTLG